MKVKFLACIYFALLALFVACTDENSSENSTQVNSQAKVGCNKPANVHETFPSEFRSINLYQDAPYPRSRVYLCPNEKFEFSVILPDNTKGYGVLVSANLTYTISLSSTKYILKVGDISKQLGDLHSYGIFDPNDSSSIPLPFALLGSVLTYEENKKILVFDYISQNVRPQYFNTETILKPGESANFTDSGIKFTVRNILGEKINIEVNNGGVYNLNIGDTFLYKKDNVWLHLVQAPGQTSMLTEEDYKKYGYPYFVKLPDGKIKVYTK